MRTSLRVRRLLREGSPKSRRAVLSVFANEHVQIPVGLRFSLASELRGAGYPVELPSPYRPYFIDASHPYPKSERIEWLRDVRRDNVLETDPLYDRLLRRNGRTSSVRLAHIDFSFDEWNGFLRPQMLRTGTEGQVGLQLAPDRKGEGISGYDDSHGTFCLGLLGQQLPNAELLPIAIGFENRVDQMVQAIEAASAAGVFAVSCSLGVGDDPTRIIEAIAAHPHMLFIQAAGNDGADLSKGTDFNRLATCSLPNLAVVGNSVQGGWALADDSNHSEEYVTHAARGEAMVSFGAAGVLETMSGTSMSAPKLANLAAKVHTLCPNLQPQLVLTLLAIANKERPEMASKVAAGGTVVAERAMLLAAAVDDMMTLGLSIDEVVKSFTISPPEKWMLRRDLENLLPGAV